MVDGEGKEGGLQVIMTSGRLGGSSPPDPCGFTRTAVLWVIFEAARVQEYTVIQIYELQVLWQDDLGGAQVDVYWHVEMLYAMLIKTDALNSVAREITRSYYEWDGRCAVGQVHLVYASVESMALEGEEEAAYRQHVMGLSYLSHSRMHWSRVYSDQKGVTSGQN